VSSLIVKVRRLTQITPHPNADRLEIATVDGWETIIQNGSHKVGDLVVFIPPDAVLPENIIEQYQLRTYLRGRDKTRVGVAKIRGVMSYGIVLPCDNGWVEGQDAAEIMGITKYEPPVRTFQGDREPEDLTFLQYIDIENFKHFSDAFKEGEDVIVTEKIDGSNSRVGIQITDEVCTLKAGSHRVNRKNPGVELWPTQTYWYPHSLNSVQDLITNFAECCIDEHENHMALYGEVYGSIKGGVKSMDYGSPNKIQYRAFGIMANHRWMNPDNFFDLCEQFGVPTVPILYKGPFDKDKIMKLLESPSVVSLGNGKNQIKEGVVIQSKATPVKILKLINPEYLLLKNKAEDKGEVFDLTDE
jgi:RNA ligase (TIGR02306 family)